MREESAMILLKTRRLYVDRYSERDEFSRASQLD
jgi:hypothetical protein